MPVPLDYFRHLSLFSIFTINTSNLLNTPLQDYNHSQVITSPLVGFQVTIFLREREKETERASEGGREVTFSLLYLNNSLLKFNMIFLLPHA